eukprot:scpid75332/ scgid11629/ Caveolin-1
MAQPYQSISASDGDGKPYGEQVPTAAPLTAAPSYGAAPTANSETAYYTSRPPLTDRHGESNSLVGDMQYRAAPGEDEEEDYLKEFVRSDFEDVIHERPETRILDTCRAFNKLTYMYSKLIWYHIFTLTFGILLSFWWAFWFALYTHFISWWYYPFYRLFKMTIYMWAVPYRAMCRAFMHPMYEAIALMFSNVRVKLHHKTEVVHPIQSA